jgi:hypothetical protein
MAMFSRRVFALAVMAVAAVAAPAQAAEKLVPLNKVFPYLEQYLKLPPAQRSRFVVAYRVLQGGKPAAGVKFWIVEGATRTPIALAADGKVTSLPNLHQVEAGQLAAEAPPQAKFGVNFSVEPLIIPGADMDATALAASVDQAQAGAKKAAGVMGFAVPTMERIYFSGVSGGELVWADGKRTPMPTAHGMPFFDAASGRKAKAVHFAQAPARMSIGPK